jgi:hypothetical protein
MKFSRDRCVSEIVQSNLEFCKIPNHQSSVPAAEQNPSSVFPDPTPRARWQRNFKSLCSTFGS